jgi:hypothetical protein
VKFASETSRSDQERKKQKEKEKKSFLEVLVVQLD